VIAESKATQASRRVIIRVFRRVNQPKSSGQMLSRPLNNESGAVKYDRIVTGHSCGVHSDLVQSGVGMKQQKKVESK
jgi:hypothetical protein